MTNLWLKIGTTFNVIQYHLWPLLEDEDVIKAMRTTKITYNESYSIYTYKNVFPLDLWRGRQYIKASQKPIISKITTDSYQCEVILSEVKLKQISEIFHFLTHMTLYVNAACIKEPILPLSLTDLYLVRRVLSPIKEGFFPKGLQVLTLLQNALVLPFHLNILPVSLRKLDLQYGFNQPIGDGLFPQDLRHLSFGYPFDQFLLYGTLPSSLTWLNVGERFNRDIGIEVLPSSLLVLIFGHSFHKELKIGVLPNSLRELKFSSSYDKYVNEDVLPKSLRYLRNSSESTLLSDVGNSFSRELDDNIVARALQSQSIGMTYCYFVYPGYIPISIGNEEEFLGCTQSKLCLSIWSSSSSSSSS